MRNQFGCITYQFRRISKNGNRCQDTSINARFAPRHYILFVILCKITFMNNIINKYLDDTSLFHHDLFITIFIYKNERVCTDPRAVPKSREPGNYPAFNDDITQVILVFHLLLEKEPRTHFYFFNVLCYFNSFHFRQTIL